MDCTHRQRGHISQFPFWKESVIHFFEHTCVDMHTAECKVILLAYNMALVHRYDMPHRSLPPTEFAYRVLDAATWHHPNDEVKDGKIIKAQMDDGSRALNEMICVFVFEVCHEDFMQNRFRDGQKCQEIFDERCEQRNTSGEVHTEKRQQQLRVQAHSVIGAHLVIVEPMTKIPGAPAAIAPSAGVYNGHQFCLGVEYGRTMTGYFMKKI